jgi:hypothetical protein
MSWLRKAKAIIACGRGTVELTSPKGERFQVQIEVTTSSRCVMFFIAEEFVGDNIRVCWELVLKCYELRTRQHKKC